MHFVAKDVKYRTWKFAIKKCIDWEGVPNDSRKFKDLLYEDHGERYIGLYIGDELTYEIFFISMFSRS